MTFPIDLPNDEWPMRRQQTETPPEKFTRTQSMIWRDEVLEFKKHTRAKFDKVGFYLHQQQLQTFLNQLFKVFQSHFIGCSIKLINI